MNKNSSPCFWIALIVTIAIGFSSCRENQLDEKFVVADEIDACEGRFPFASDEDLKSFEHNSEVIDPRLARKQALLDLFQFQDVFSDLSRNRDCDNFQLSSRPIVVYDEEDQPKLYEFIVFAENNAIATITTFATKEVADISACVLPFVRNYTGQFAQQFSANYPSTKSNAESESRDNQVKSKIALDSTFDLNFVMSTSDIKSFWKGVDEKVSSVVSMSDQQIHDLYISQLLRSNTREYIIPAFNKENLKRTRFAGSGWCGPCAMAWVYRGLYDHYDECYIPLHGEPSNEVFHLNVDEVNNVSFYDKENVLLSKLADLCRTEKNLITGTLPNDFDNAVEVVFPTKRILRHKGEIKGAPRKAIQRGNPVYLVVFTKKGELHYIVGFGTKDTYGLFGSHTNSWILVTDNGTNTKDYGFMPYYRNSHFFNLSNKYLYMGEFVSK